MKPLIELPTYPGGKGADGVYQTIINQIPPHDIWVSGFLGHCAITRYKKLAKRNFLFELNKNVISRWNHELSKKTDWTNIDIITDDFMSEYVKKCYTYWKKYKLFTYLDPPYRHEDRTSGMRYKYELIEDQQIELLQLASKLPGMVAISSYPNKLYDTMLSDWRRITYTAQTRGGARTEALYMNYEEPTELHDYRYLGSDFREREGIKRRRETILRKINKLQPSEKLAILETIKSVY